MKSVRLFVLGLLVLGFAASNAKAGVVVAVPDKTILCFGYDSIHGNFKLDVNYFRPRNINLNVYSAATDEFLFHRSGSGYLNYDGTGQVSYYTPGGTAAGYVFNRNNYGQLKARFHLAGRWSPDELSCE